VTEEALMRAQSTDTHRRNIDLSLHGVNGRFDNMEQAMEWKFGEQKAAIHTIVKTAFMMHLQGQGMSSGHRWRTV
jgi:hypothetical protein